MLAISGHSSLAADESADTDSGLFYAAEAAMNTDNNWELRLNAGQDFSNSFLNIYQVQAGAFWLLDPSISIGLEGGIFFHSKKGSAETITDPAAGLGYTYFALAPLAQTVAVFRITPLSGMVNFFSSGIVKIDVSLLARAGAIQYQTVGWGPCGGFGLETSVGVSKSFGFNVAFHYELDKPNTQNWLWRAGFSVGPTFRF